MNKELAKTLTLALVNYIDENRPEGTMDCSSAECKSIEEMFEGDQFDIIEAFVQKKLSRLTEFEQEVSDIVEYCKEHGENVAFDYAKRHAKTLLALAKKELLSYADESNPAIEAMADLERTFECNPDKLPLWLKNKLDKIRLDAEAKGYKIGYDKGYKVATKLCNESVAYHYPEPVPPGVAYKSPQCYTDVMVTPNTASGTSTATLHGNTSATDGKEHNPSFTD